MPKDAHGDGVLGRNKSEILKLFNRNNFALVYTRGDKSK